MLFSLNAISGYLYIFYLIFSLNFHLKHATCLSLIYIITIVGSPLSNQFSLILPSPIPRQSFLNRLISLNGFRSLLQPYALANPVIARVSRLLLLLFSVTWHFYHFIIIALLSIQSITHLFSMTSKYWFVFFNSFHP